MSFQGKIQYVSQPALPAKCICCGNHWKGNGEYMIDFQVSMDEYGAVLFCESCAGELAGLVSVPAIESRNEQIRNLTEMNRELQENNVHLNTTLDNLLAVRPHLRNSDSVGGQASGESPVEGEPEARKK